MERQAYNLDLLIRQMREASLKQNRVLTTTQFKKASQLYDHHVNWHQFVELCNFGLSVKSMQQIKPIERNIFGYQCKYSRGELIEIGRIYNRKTCKIPTISTIKQSGTITKLWQSWTDYLLACGFEIQNIRSYRKRELLIRSLQLRGIELQRIPLLTEFAHSGAAIQLFGNWKNSINECGFVLTVK